MYTRKRIQLIWLIFIFHIFFSTIFNIFTHNLSFFNSFYWVDYVNLFFFYTIFLEKMGKKNVLLTRERNTRCNQIAIRELLDNIMKIWESFAEHQWKCKMIWEKMRELSGNSCPTSVGRIYKSSLSRFHSFFTSKSRRKSRESLAWKWKTVKIFLDSLADAPTLWHLLHEFSPTLPACPLSECLSPIAW